MSIGSCVRWERTGKAIFHVPGLKIFSSYLTVLDTVHQPFHWAMMQLALFTIWILPVPLSLPSAPHTHTLTLFFASVSNIIYFLTDFLPVFIYWALLFKYVYKTVSMGMYITTMYGNISSWYVSLISENLKSNTASQTMNGLQWEILMVRHYIHHSLGKGRVSFSAQVLVCWEWCVLSSNEENLRMMC